MDANRTTPMRAHAPGTTFTSLPASCNSAASQDRWPASPAVPKPRSAKTHHVHSNCACVTRNPCDTPTARPAQHLLDELHRCLCSAFQCCLGRCSLSGLSVTLPGRSPTQCFTKLSVLQRRQHLDRPSAMRSASASDISVLLLPT